MNFRDILIEILSTALTAALICLIRSGIIWIGTKTKSEKIRTALSEFQTVLEDGVGYIEQTYVKLAKETETWNREEQVYALNSCIKYIKKNLTQKTLDILTEDKKDIEEWITAKIESYISSLKN